MTSLAEAAEQAMRRHLAELMEIQQLSMPLESRADKDTNNGSVLAIVNFPDKPGRDCNGIASFAKVYQIRLDYDRLVSTGSTKIKEMLTPRKQARYRRLLNLETLPDGIDHVLDFTPPSEGEESAELIANLWLPYSTRIWWMAGYYHPSGLLESGPREGSTCKRPLAEKAVGAVLVLGHDDQCTCSTTYADVQELWASREGVPGIYPGDWVPPYRNVAEYCRVRHCVSILRLLRAIAGADLMINSATRMWTLVHLALHLDLASIVRDGVTQWFSAAPNTKFIELFPEESFKVALKLQMKDVLVASFRILVSERAVDHAATTPLTKPPPKTWMGRQRTDYGDLPEDPVEHASRAFADRMKAKLDSLRDDQVYDKMGIGEWGKLQRYSKAMSDAEAAATEPVPARLALMATLSKLKVALSNVLDVHVRVCLIVDPPQRLANLIVAQRAHCCPQEKQIRTDNFIARLNDHQRVCLPFFWFNLKDMFPNLHSSKFRLLQSPQGQSLLSIVREFNAKLVDYMGQTGDLADRFEEAERLRYAPSSYGFDEELFHTQLQLQLSVMSTEVIGFRDFESEGIPYFMSDHLLLTLKENELKYLPLWAGGFDDGSGGVFQDEVPPTDMGPNQPGPHYHTGHTVASETGDTDAMSTTYAPTLTFSDLGLDNLDLEDNTTARSMVAQDSISTVLGRSEVVSVASEAFTSGDEESMAEAMSAVPAEHQARAQALAHYLKVSADDREPTAEFEFEMGGEVGDGDDDDSMDTDSTLSLGNRSDKEDDFDMV